MQALPEDRLNDDLLAHVLSYLPFNYLFCAPVNKRWKKVYTLHHGQETDFCNAVASSSTCAIFRQACEHGHCYFAAKYGTIETIMYFRQQHGLPWNELKIEVLPSFDQYLYPWEKDKYLYTDTRDPLYLDEPELEAMTGAVEGGNTENLMFLQSCGISLKTQHLYAAIRCDNAEMVAHIYQHFTDRYKYQKNLFCELACKYGSLKSLQLLRMQGCPWSQSCTQRACKNGRLEILKWMREQQPPCPWNAECCKNAAWYATFHRDLSVLRWLRSQDPPCPWDTECMTMASWWANMYDNLEVLQWLRGQDPPCPWDEASFFMASRAATNLKVVRWLYENGCPFNFDEVYNDEHAVKQFIKDWMVDTIPTHARTFRRSEYVVAETQGEDDDDSTQSWDTSSDDESDSGQSVWLICCKLGAR